MKWGFSYNDSKFNIPIDEIDEYVNGISDFYKKQAAANRGQQDNSNLVQDSTPKSIGQTNPAAF